MILSIVDRLSHQRLRRLLVASVVAPPRSFSDALHSTGPASDRAKKMQLYAWLVGNWDMDVVIHRPDGAKQSTQGFVHAGWVLEGRAIQDVFAVPQLFYGTTLRIYDPSLDIWYIRWIDPLNQVFCEQVGRAQGGTIVQEGEESESLARLYGSARPGLPPGRLRWSFTDITPRSFLWKSERSTDGTHWQLQREYFARRVS